MKRLVVATCQFSVEADIDHNCRWALKQIDEAAASVFQSYHNARKSVVADPKYNIWKTIVPATMMCRAAENHLWFSANNSTTRPSKWGSFFVRPDGQILGRLAVHRPGVLITPVERDPKLFDASGLWRESAMTGCLHSGSLVDHPRSQDVTCW